MATQARLLPRRPDINKDHVAKNRHDVLVSNDIAVTGLMWAINRMAVPYVCNLATYRTKRYHTPSKRKEPQRLYSRIYPVLPVFFQKIPRLKTLNHLD
jgi:hypothetical protein